MYCFRHYTLAISQSTRSGDREGLSAPVYDRESPPLHRFSLTSVDLSAQGIQSNEDCEGELCIRRSVMVKFSQSME